MGARVVAAVSSEGKALAAAQAGADRTLVYPLDLSDRAVAKSLADDFKSAVGPHGAHVVFDPVGGDYAEPALRSIAWEGRYLVLGFTAGIPRRSEEHTSELQSLMRISYAVFCLTKKT